VLWPRYYTLLLDVDGNESMRPYLVRDKVLLDEWPQPIDGSYARSERN
jgi:hypothetical protein